LPASVILSEAKDLFAPRRGGGIFRAGGATFFAHGGKEGKTPLDPTVQDSLYDMQSNFKVKRKERLVLS
jgi:hypothetical protein